MDQDEVSSNDILKFSKHKIHQRSERILNKIKVANKGYFKRIFRPQILSRMNWRKTEQLGRNFEDIFLENFEAKKLRLRNLRLRN